MRTFCLKSAYNYIRSGFWLFNSVSKRCYPSFINQDLKDDFNEEETMVEDKLKGSQYNKLYEGHIQTTNFQKGLLAIGSAVMCLYNPARDDMICALGESSGYWALKKMRERMVKDPIGRQILEEKPRINSQTVDLDYLCKLPEGTFGKTYYYWLEKNGVSPDSRRPVNFVDDVELAYVMLRYRECHDLIHALLGMPTNMLGECAVKWVEAFQTGLPLCVLGGIFGPLRLGPRHRKRHATKYLPWAVRVGRHSKFLMNVYFEKHWEDNLLDLRKQLNIASPPHT